MLILKDTDTLEVVLAAAVATTQLDCEANFVQTDPDEFDPDASLATTNNTTVVTLVSAPAAGKFRTIKYVGVYNRDTATAVVTVQRDRSATNYTVCKVALRTGEKLQYTEDGGWHVITNGGSVKTSQDEPVGDGIVRIPYEVYKAQATSEGAGTFHSLWAVVGNPAAGAVPPAFTAGSGYVPTRATTGALGQADADTGNNLFITEMDGSTSTVNKYIFYDRLWACSGFGTVVTTLQSVTTPGSLPSGRLRAAGDYGGTELWLEVYTAPGATGATWTIIYVDGGGTSRTATYTHPANAESIGQMIKVTPPTGAAAGVQSITSFQCSVSSGTAGNIGATILHRMGSVNCPIANIGAVNEGKKEVKDDACIAMMVQCTTTNTGVFFGEIEMAEYPA